jgi:hypothetical protein
MCSFEFQPKLLSFVVLFASLNLIVGVKRLQLSFGKLVLVLLVLVLVLNMMSLFCNANN